MKTQSRKDQVLRGALLLVAADMMFAGMGAGIKQVSTELPNEVVVFMRNLMGLLVLTPWLFRQGISTLKPRHPYLLMLRALAGLSAMYCFFYALAHMPLAEAMLFKLTVPFFIPVIAVVWLGERMTLRVGWAILIGFFGAAVILRPGSEAAASAAMIGLSGSAFAALAKVTIRRMALDESGSRIVFYFAAIATLVSAVPLLWAWKTPSPASFLLLVAVALFATAGQLLMTRAYLLSPASRLGPFSYTSVVFGGLLGWLFWGEVLDLRFLVGAALVFVAGALVLQQAPKKAHRPLRTDS